MDLLKLFHKEKDLGNYAEGDVVFSEGEPGDKMYVVIEGEVGLSVRGVAIDTIKAGQMFGEMALIDDEPRSATAKAKTACKLAAVDERRFAFLVQQTPYFALEVIRVMAKRLRVMDNTIP
jgi:CRP/FNR family transcriptional regulator, cyclic AMP receptor protein